MPARSAAPREIIDMNTPYYLIDERKLLANLKKIRRLKMISGAKSVLALKCFSGWCVFDLMRKYMDGTTSSSLYEARLGREKFGKETHAYSVAFSKDELNKVKKYADKIIFNSLSQLNRFGEMVSPLSVGLRINPGVSYSRFELADPACRFSRLGVTDIKSIDKVSRRLSGAMFHFNCENNDYLNFKKNVSFIASKYGAILKKLEWVSFGGGIHFTGPAYPLAAFSRLLKEFSRTFGVQVYLEPGEAAITQSAQLVTTVLDIVKNKKDIAIVDSSVEAHALDLLVYRQRAALREALTGKHEYIVAGRSCLAGDVFGTFKFKDRLKIGSILKIQDAAGYTMVKKNWFNGLQMPAIAVKRLNGSLEMIREFGYKDYIKSLS
jgi:carboxynorspermidine decarboxylase